MVSRSNEVDLMYIIQAQEAALDAFSSLCRENIDISRASLNARGKPECNSICLLW
jgi:hypothetical protein